MEKANGRILVVDDEVKIVEAVCAYLENSGYSVMTAFDGEQALDQFEKMNPDLVILDLMLPKLSGEQVCSMIRKKSMIPIIMLTAKVTEKDKINGLNIGADDYIVKPFSPRELVARVASLLRRCSYGISPFYDTISLNGGECEVNFTTRVVKRQGKELNLTPNEFKLFATMIRYPQKVFTREELIELSLGLDYDGYDRTIDSHIKNLRSKIEEDSSNPKYIITVRGTGYKFVCEHMRQ